ncbi:glycosyltransferase family 2 protein [bacterium]|nr:glycosyltransferase family 2 protein [bacterium]
MDLILDIIYLYIGIFSIYFFILGIRNLNDRKFLRYKKYATLIEKSMLCVVLYAHNNYEYLKNMLSQLSKQNYPADKFVIQVILDNCNDHSEELISASSNIRLMNLNDGVTVGKDQAVSILLESLRQDDLIDSYVFVDINRYVEEDFLDNANFALSISPVISGNTIVIENDNLTFSEKIKIAYQKFNSNFVRKARSLLGLSDRIEGSLLAIKKDFVEKIDALDIQDINTELKYSILISSLGYPCLFIPFWKSYIKSFDFEIKRPSLSYRISLFRQCLTKLFTFRIKFIEHILSLVAPSGLVAILLSVFYLLFTLKYYFICSFIIVFTIFSFLILGFALGLLKSELYAKDFLFLSLYPLYSIFHILDNLPPYRFFKKYILNSENSKKDIQKYSVKVIASNGKANVPCKLDFISENGMARVVFSFKKKKFTSSRQIRMVEALNELTAKLNDYGFNLKICYCCEYFSSIVDGTTNMITGVCNYPFKDKSKDEPLSTLIWNSCSICKLKKITSVIEDIRRS